MSRFNELVHGGADRVADILQGDDPPATTQELRAALGNSLRRIAQLERALENVRDELRFRTTRPDAR